MNIGSKGETESKYPGFCVHNLEKTRKMRKELLGWQTKELYNYAAIRNYRSRLDHEKEAETREQV